MIECRQTANQTACKPKMSNRLESFCREFGYHDVSGICLNVCPFFQIKFIAWNITHAFCPRYKTSVILRLSCELQIGRSRWFAALIWESIPAGVNRQRYIRITQYQISSFNLYSLRILYNFIDVRYSNLQCRICHLSHSFSIPDGLSETSNVKMWMAKAKKISV